MKPCLKDPASLLGLLSAFTCVKKKKLKKGKIYSDFILLYTNELWRSVSISVSLESVWFTFLSHVKFTLHIPLRASNENLCRTTAKKVWNLVSLKKKKNYHFTQSACESANRWLSFGLCTEHFTSHSGFFLSLLLNQMFPSATAQAADAKHSLT